MFKVLHMQSQFPEFNIDDVADSLSNFQLQTPIHPSFNAFGTSTNSANMTKELEEAKLAFETYFQSKCKGHLLRSPCIAEELTFDNSRFNGSSRQRSPLSALPILQNIRCESPSTSPIPSLLTPQEATSFNAMENILSSCLQKRALTKKNGKIQKTKKTSVCLRRGKGTLQLNVSPTVPKDDVIPAVSATKL
jgi:hypothetical protein